VRIIEACVRYPPAKGGAETHVHALATRLKARGHDVSVYTSNLNTEFPMAKLDLPYDQVDGVPVRRFSARSLPGGAHWVYMPSMKAMYKDRADIIHANNSFFENDRAWRDIWTDGRKLPGPDADSNWYGYAVGRWEGDTFVVNSNNFNDATWLDQYGSPHSDQMTVEERYRRVDHDHLEMTLNITDPKTYVGTWKGDKKIFQLVEKPTRSAYNDFNENICVWSETKREVHP